MKHILAPVPLLSLRIGQAVPFGPNGEPSAIDKAASTRALLVRATGLEGDAQGDRRFHGGPEKALHHYAFDHYPHWQAQLPLQAGRFATAGAFGENLVTLGLTEDNVCIGDRFALGGAIIAVSQARQPCWKLNLRFARDDMAALVQASLRTGWYYRVLQPGWVAPHDQLMLLQRTQPDWPLTRILQAFYRDPLHRDALQAIAALPELSESWRLLAQKRLQLGCVEDWTARLETPQPHT